jgi:hypothetical protein
MFQREALPFIICTMIRVIVMQITPVTCIPAFIVICRVPLIQKKPKSQFIESTIQLFYQMMMMMMIMIMMMMMMMTIITIIIIIKNDIREKGNTKRFRIIQKER